MFCPRQGASAEEVKRMEKEVREQEQLLTGYQQENERLYKELKQMQAKEKANEARMFSENQKLGKEDFFDLLQYCELSLISPAGYRLASPVIGRLPRLKARFSG